MAIYYSFQDLYSRVSQYLGTGPTPSGVALLIAQQLTNSGIRRFLAAHNWTFKRSSQDAGITLNMGDTMFVLPPDFLTLTSDITHDGAGPMVTLTDEATVRRHRAANMTPAAPYLFAIRVDGTLSPIMYTLIFSPIPDDVYSLSYSYEQQPQDLVAPNDVPLGGIAHAETILESCLSAAENYSDDTSAHHTAQYQRLLSQSIELDHKLPGSKLGMGEQAGSGSLPLTEGPAMQGGVSNG